MILEYSHLSRHDNVPFEDYAQWPEFSHSFLKYQKNGLLLPKEIGDNIIFGKIVDAIQSNDVSNELYSHDFYPLALHHSSIINDKFGSILRHFIPQVCYKGRITHNGWILPVKVRLDMLLADKLLFENKITFSGCQNKKAATNIKIKSMLDLIAHMGYDNQVYHQMQMSKVPAGYIMIHSVPLQETFLFKRFTNTGEWEFSESWWVEQVKLFGI